jgi:hypothetical protein
VNNAGYQIIQMGYPNIGNNTYIGMSPPQAWNWPGSTYDYGNRANGGFVFSTAQGPTTNLVGNFSYVPSPAGSVYAIFFQDGRDTNRYFTSINGQCVVSIKAGTSASLQLNTPVSVNAGDRLFVAGQTAFQQLQAAETNTHFIYGNYDYYHKAVLPAQQTLNLTDSILYPGGRPEWWGLKRWPAVEPAGVQRIVTIPAQDRYLNSSPSLNPPPSRPQGLRINDGTGGAVAQTTGVSK